MKTHAPHMRIENGNYVNTQHMQVAEPTTHIIGTASPSDPLPNQAHLHGTRPANAQTDDRQHDEQSAPALRRQSNVTASGRIEAGPAADTPQTAISESRIGPDQPIAHDVGLLSLGSASSDPKYLGPSSGVSFARLLYAAAPQSQGLPASTSDASSRVESEPVPCAPLPTVSQMNRFLGQSQQFQSDVDV